MKIKINKKPRKFTVGLNNTILKDLGKIYLNNNEHSTFIKKVNTMKLKDWGYYATPSVNKRLKILNFEHLSLKIHLNQFILIVHKEKIKNFRKYLRADKLKL